MNASGTQLLERRRQAVPPAPANPSMPWLRQSGGTDEVCVTLTAPEGDSPLDVRPANLPPGGVLAALWQRPDFLTQFQTVAQRCLLGEQVRYEMQVELPGFGSRRFDLSFYPQRTGGAARGVAVVRDITDRQRAVGQLQLMLEIVHELSVSPDLRTATESVLATLCTVSRWPVAEIWLPTAPGALELFSAVARPDFSAGQAFHHDSAGVVLRNGKGLIEQVWTGGATFIPDLGVEPEALRSRAAARAGLAAAFALPVKHGEETLGLMLFFLPTDQPPDVHWTTLAGAVAAELGAVFKRERMQEQLDTFFNRSLDLHCLAGFDGFLKRVNPAWTQTLGYETNELLTHPLIEIVHPDDRPRFLEGLAQLGRGENLSGIEVRCLAKNGSERCVLWNATPLSSQHLVIATGRDITRRKLTEAAVRQSEEHYRDLFHQAYQMQENLRRMSDRVLKVQEHERSRISRDLHDEVGQALTAVNMNLALVRQALGTAVPEAEQRIRDTQQLVEQTMINIHNFSRELRPAMLDDLGLLPALRNYTKIFSERTGVAVHLDATQSESIELLDSERKTVVYRIIQEGLNNVAKHAEAHRVEIMIAGSLHDVRIQLGDDGRGFAPGARPDSAPKQLGLLGLAERVRLVGGEFAIASMPSRGTILRATIPFRTV